jgi:hypothetical protein
MAFQSRTNFQNFPFILQGSPKHRDSEVIKQDAGRTTPLVSKTVMAQIAATRKWVPLTDVAALDGSNTARGVYIGDDVTAAALVAGDVAGAVIIVYGESVVLDASQLVLENSLTLNSVCSDVPAGADNGAVNVRRIEDDLLRIGIMTIGTVDIDGFENS